MNLKIIEWNVNMRSKKGLIIPSLIVAEIEKLNADVVCLTEYVRGINHTDFITSLKYCGYETFLRPMTEQTGGNEILLALKSEIVNDPEVFILPSGKDSPDFLHVSTLIGSHRFHIVGVRVRIGGEEELDKDFQSRRVQIQTLVENLQNIEDEKMIIVGDFNNGFYSKGDDRNSYPNKPRQYYNYPLLSDDMRKAGFDAHTPTEGFSWGKCFRLDHLFAKQCAIKSVKYSWNFKHNSQFKNGVGYPDHAMLIAELI